MTTPPSTPHGQQPHGAGHTPGWASAPSPMAPPQPQPPTGKKPSRGKTWLTHGATAFVALIVGTMISGGGESDASADSARPTPTVTVTKTADVPEPEPAAEEKPVKDTPKPAEKAGPSAAIDGDGQFLVGEDLQAGTYKTAGPADDTFGLGCYWARHKDASGEFDAIIANGNLTGPARVAVNEGEYFETTGCQKWEKTG